MPGTAAQSPADLGTGWAQGVPLAFPLVIAEWDRNSREVVRVALDHYKGHHSVNVRVWYRDGGQLKPGKAGIALGLKHLPNLCEALQAALSAAQEHGLI